MKKLILIAFILCFTLLVNPKSIKQKKSDTQLQYEVTVTLKLVQVYVTDKNGNPVTDLTKDDFILYDNGKLQVITDFEKHLLIQPEKKVEEEIAKTELPPAEDVSSRMNRKFFLLLDYYRNDVFGVNKSKNAALHFIDTKLQPTDEVAVLSYSQMRGLILHEYLTTDHQKVRETIKKMRGTLRWGVEEPTLKTPEESYMLYGTPVDASGAPAEDLRFEKVKAQDFPKIIKEFAKFLRYIPGYKNIILFSAGLSNSMMRDRYDSTLRELFEDMCKELASSSTPVYTVDTCPKTRELFKGAVLAGDDSLKSLSDLSGGKYFNDVTRYESVAREIQNITGNYYVLGYYIDEKWDGKFHKIKVEVKRKGCNVYAQEGFFNPKPFSEFSEVEKRLHLFDLAMSKNPKVQTPYILPAIALPCSGKEESNLVMLTETTMDKIKEFIKGECEVLALIFGEENNIADSHEGKVNFYTIPQKKIYLYSISSLLPGSYECRFVLRDIKTGKGAVASSSVVIPEPTDSGIKLFPPLLLIPEEKASYLKLSHDQEKELEKESLSLNIIYPFLPKNFFPLVEEADQGIEKLLAVLRLSIVDVPESEIKIYAHLIDRSSNKKIPLHNTSIHAAEKREGTDVLLIEFQLPELEAGEYSVEIIAEEMTTQEKSQTTRTFKIRER